MVKDRFQPVTVITAVQYSNSSYGSNHRNSDFYFIKIRGLPSLGGTHCKYM